MSLPGALSDPGAVVVLTTTVTRGDAAFDAHLARPALPGIHPGVVLVDESLGIDDHIRDVGRRLAHAGYVTLVPDLSRHRTDRHFDEADAADAADAVAQAAREVPDDEVAADLEAAAAVLRHRGDTTRSVGCVGFSAGGRHALVAACTTSSLDAVVDCWGGWVDQAPDDPLALAARATCPVLIVGGELDTDPSPAALVALGEALGSSDQEVTVDVFADAGHAFFADDRDTYHPAAAHALWPRLLDFLDTHLARPG